ncbi:MAG: histidinol-phosphate aminotransferase family protein [Ruminococcus sp.]|nr:histidinol-phosphate aminotransferase family protein [Ruminococcus sp.]
MAYELTKKLKGIDMYVPVEGTCKVRLDANESCYNIMDKLGDEILAEIKEIELNRYPDPSAERVTRAFADFYGVSASMCTAGNGSDELISLILGAFLEKGDNVLTLSPDFSMYGFYGYMNELKVKTLQKEENLRVNVSKVADYCNNNDIKAVIFSNPCNPTSLGVPREDIVKLLKNVFCLVIVDEAYMDFWGESVLDRVTEFDNLIVLRTCSKNMGLAAARLGFAVASPSITAALKAVKSPYNTSTLDQAAACAVLRNKPMIAEYTAETVQSRKALQAALEELSENFGQIERVYDSVTNFVFFKSSKSEEICGKLEENSIAVRRIGGCIRVTAGTKEENEIFLSALKEILAETE